MFFEDGRCHISYRPTTSSFLTFTSSSSHMMRWGHDFTGDTAIMILNQAFSVTYRKRLPRAASTYVIFCLRRRSQSKDGVSDIFIMLVAASLQKSLALQFMSRENVCW